MPLNKRLKEISKIRFCTPRTTPHLASARIGSSRPHRIARIPPSSSRRRGAARKYLPAANLRRRPPISNSVRLRGIAHGAGAVERRRAALPEAGWRHLLSSGRRSWGAARGQRVEGRGVTAERAPVRPRLDANLVRGGAPVPAGPARQTHVYARARPVILGGNMATKSPSAGGNSWEPGCVRSPFSPAGTEIRRNVDGSESRLSRRCVDAGAADCARAAETAHGSELS